MSDSTNDSDDHSVLDLIAAINSGKTPGKSLKKPARLSCIEFLRAEVGLSVPNIARTFGMSDRQMRRDLKEIREANALRVSPDLVAEQIGALTTEAATCISRIRRVTREREAPHAARIDGEKAVFDIMDRLTARLQSVGYLPSAAQKVQAELTHHVGEVPSLSELTAQLAGLAELASTAVGVPPELAADFQTAAENTQKLLPAPTQEPASIKEDHDDDAD